MGIPTCISLKLFEPAFFKLVHRMLVNYNSNLFVLFMYRAGT